MAQGVRERSVEISAQAEEYLEAVCRVLDRGALATPTELAHELGVAPPSVLGMIHRLIEQGLATYSRQTGAVLTERGTVCAGALRRRHRLAERLLTDLLGMPWERAHTVACRFEHIIDDEVETYLDTALHHPTTCPHGNPLDITASRPNRTLASLETGQSCRMLRVIDESDATLEYLARVGLTPGTWVTIRERAPELGPLTVEINGERYALSFAMAAILVVEMESIA